MRYAMIMAGGSGTRLWPLSTKDRPKQLVPMIERDGRRLSLMQLADARLDGLIDQANRYICTGEKFRSAIRDAMSAYDDAHILGEPAGRDTVNAVGFAAAVLEKLDPDAIFAVLTADHIIEPAHAFASAMRTGLELVEDDPRRLVTFAIEPTYPATGFGYVKRGADIPRFEGRAFEAVKFVEKPDLKTAESYLREGGFGWNSGMFVWSAAAFMRCLERYLPESHRGLREIAGAWGTSSQQSTIERVYPTLPKISVDYAVMEPAARETDGSVRVCVAPMKVDWLDVGSWPSYAQTIACDAAGNAHVGTSALRGCKDSLVVNAEDDGHLVALLGCEGLVVVRTKGATLVMPRERAEELKALHAELPDGLK